MKHFGVFRVIIERGWWLILLVLLGGTAFFALSIPRIEINANTDAFIEEESKEVSAYYDAREEWGTDEFAILCVTAEDWFSREGIQRLVEIEADLKGAPFVASTMSILDVPLLRQRPDKKPNLLFIKKAMKDLRDEDVDFVAAAAELTNHELARGNLVSADGKSVNILAYLDWTKTPDGRIIPPMNTRRAELVRGVREVAAKWSARLDEPVRVSGLPIIQRTVYENIRHDLIVFGIAAFAMFTLALLVIYRRPRFVLIPIVCCLIPSAGMLGAMSFFDLPVALVTSNMPVLLFVLMLPYNVYFIERYRERRARNPEEEGWTSTLAALRSIAVPCLFSCATTLACFIAISTSRVIPIRDFGEIMTIGMAIGFAVVFLFIPAAYFRLKGLKVEHSVHDTFRPSTGLVRLFERVSLARPGLVVLLSLGILVVAILGARRLSAESKFTSYFWPSSEVYQGLEFIDQKMGGTTWIEILLSSEKEGYFRKKKGLDALAVVERYFDNVPETGNIMSLNSLRDEMRKTFPPDRLGLITDGTLLTLINLTTPDLVQQTTDRKFTTSRATIRMKETAPTLNRNRILEGLRQHIAAHPESFEGLKVEITGVFPVYAEMLTQLLAGQKQSIIAVPLAVFLMLLLLFRSPLLAVIVLIPQALPATVLLGIMGWAGIPLDLVTVMIASIAIGVGIDAAIQYTMRFRRELDATGDHTTAVRRAHATIGRAIWNATSIIVAGFAILLLSDFFPSFWFGLFTALAMLLSQLATLTMLPSLFLLTGYPKRRNGGIVDARPGRSIG